ncbi:hypothetical protein SLE2022_142550 [Rubroshorea leprosula]
MLIVVVMQLFEREVLDLSFTSVIQELLSYVRGWAPQTYPYKPIPQLSPLANSVVSRCSKILRIPTEELQHHFDIELPESVRQLFTYARNFLEFFSFQALHQITRRLDHLSDPEFRQLTYDMMLAWEAPSVECEQTKENTLESN